MLRQRLQLLSARLQQPGRAEQPPACSAAVSGQSISSHVAGMGSSDRLSEGAAQSLPLMHALQHKHIPNEIDNKANCNHRQGDIQMQQGHTQSIKLKASFFDQS